jgi:hypothetical protein
MPGTAPFFRQLSEKYSELIWATHGASRLAQGLKSRIFAEIMQNTPLTASPARELRN